MTRKKTALIKHDEAGAALLVPDINNEHEAAQRSAREAMEHAVAAGKLLIEAKKKVGHGGWAEWVETNCKFSARTASDYMRCAEHKRKIGPDAAADSIRGALAKLAKPKPKEGTPKPKEGAKTDNHYEPAPPGEPTEEDIAAQIARDVEAELATWAPDLDTDVIRERVIELIKFKPDGVPKQIGSTLPKKHGGGRPKGSKNKSKPEAPAAAGNTGDPVDEGETMKAKHAAADATEPPPAPAPAPAPAEPPTEPDLSIPPWMDRRTGEQAA